MKKKKQKDNTWEGNTLSLSVSEKWGALSSISQHSQLCSFHKRCGHQAGAVSGNSSPESSRFPQRFFPSLERYHFPSSKCQLVSYFYFMPFESNKKKSLFWIHIWFAALVMGLDCFISLYEWNSFCPSQTIYSLEELSTLTPLLTITYLQHWKSSQETVFSWYHLALTRTTFNLDKTMPQTSLAPYCSLTAMITFLSS